MNAKALYSLSYGVYVLSAMDNNRPTGCVINSAVQITSSPMTVAVSVNHDNYTNGCIKASGAFAVSVLTQASNPSLIGQFGFKTGRDFDKFNGVEYTLSQGLPVLKDACAYIVCKVIDTMNTPTHTVFLGEVIDADTQGGGIPMTYAYYHDVIKGSSPKNAPTYIAEEPKAQAQKPREYVCSICGYVYDGEIPFEQLPDSYVCPICSAPKSAFVLKE